MPVCQMFLLLTFYDMNLAYFRPATLWYHDHAVGITSENVYAGALLRISPECSVEMLDIWPT
jgi:hypothetical protein